MKFGVNALFNASGGSFTNLQILIEEWTTNNIFKDHQCFLFVGASTYEKLKNIIPAEVQVVVSKTAAWGTSARLIVEQVWLPRLLKKYQLDVLYCPANSGPWFTKTPTVITFQNAAPFTTELTSGVIGWRRFLRFYILKTIMIFSAKNAKCLIFGSDFFRKLFCKQSRCDFQRTLVIYRSSRKKSDERQFTSESTIVIPKVKTPFLLCVSHLQPYKNLIEAIEGFQMAKESGWIADDVQFVIAGGVYVSPDYAKSVYSAIQIKGLSEGDIVLTGDLSRNEIDSLLEEADAFLFPSTCENCPTALIEAMQARLPIACSNRSSMPEVMGDAAIYFNPDDPQAIAKAIQQLFSPHVKQELRRLVEKRSANWPGIDEMASQTWEAIRASSVN